MHKIKYLFCHGEYLTLTVLPMVVIRRIAVYLNSIIVDRSKYWFIDVLGDFAIPFSLVAIMVALFLWGFVAVILASLIHENAVLIVPLVMISSFLLVHFSILAVLESVRFALIFLRWFFRGVNRSIDQAETTYKSAQKSKSKNKREKRDFQRIIDLSTDGVLVEPPPMPDEDQYKQVN